MRIFDGSGRSATTARSPTSSKVCSSDHLRPTAGSGSSSASSCSSPRSPCCPLAVRSLDRDRRRRHPGHLGVLVDAVLPRVVAHVRPDRRARRLRPRAHGGRIPASTPDPPGAPEPIRPVEMRPSAGSAVVSGTGHGRDRRELGAGCGTMRAWRSRCSSPRPCPTASARWPASEWWTSRRAGQGRWRAACWPISAPTSSRWRPPAARSRCPAPPDLPGTNLGYVNQAGNRNKRSMTIDLHVEAGRRLFLDLVATADVLVENFRTGTLDGWGIGYEHCRAVKPDIVFVSITGWGQYGPLCECLPATTRRRRRSPAGWRSTASPTATRPRRRRGSATTSPACMQRSKRGGRPAVPGRDRRGPACRRLAAGRRPVPVERGAHPGGDGSPTPAPGLGGRVIDTGQHLRLRRRPHLPGRRGRRGLGDPLPGDGPPRPRPCRRVRDRS